MISVPFCCELYLERTDYGQIRSRINYNYVIVGCFKPLSTADKTALYFMVSRPDIHGSVTCVTILPGSCMAIALLLPIFLELLHNNLFINLSESQCYNTFYDTIEKYCVMRFVSSHGSHCCILCVHLALGER